MGRDRRPWWASNDEGRTHHSNGYGETPTGSRNGKGGPVRASGDHGTAPGVAESHSTITLEEWKRRQVSEYTRLVTGTEHVIVLTEQEMPRAFEVRCTACHNPAPHDRCRASCHRVTWTPWGEEVASEIGRLHIFYMEHPDAPRLHQQRETAANRIR